MPLKLTRFKLSEKNSLKSFSLSSTFFLCPEYFDEGTSLVRSLTCGLYYKSGLVVVVRVIVSNDCRMTGLIKDFDTSIGYRAFKHY